MSKNSLYLKMLKLKTFLFGKCNNKIIKRVKLQDKSRGSLVGGAVGDALGYEVEFMSYDDIRNRFGKLGITNYVLNSDGIAEFSDDTQMSLFTAEGLLSAISNGKNAEEDILPYITESYKHWYYTQQQVPFMTTTNWLMYIKALWTRRAPGATCISALQSISTAGCAPVFNNSKGCGGVMRVAPIGIFSAAHPKILDIEYAGHLSGSAANITHKHRLSTYSSMALSMIVADCIAYDKVDRSRFRFIVVDHVFKLLRFYFKDDKYLDELSNLMSKALDLAITDKTDNDAINELGEGWVAEETLAIAVFCVMRYIDNFEKCIVCSVNHNGDSDSTGAVAGNIIGAILGYNAIPMKYLVNLELHDVLVTVADDLAGVSDKTQIIERYVKHQPFNVKHSYLFKMDKPIKHSYCVLADKVYAGEYVGDINNPQEKVSQLVSFGITHFIDLTEVGELIPYDILLPKECIHYRFPIKDVSIPKLCSEVYDLMEYVSSIIANPTNKIYIHCWGGVGRTGVIVACFYEYLGESYDIAVEHLRKSFMQCPKSYSRDSPETEEQLEFIRSFDEYVKQKRL